MNKHLRLSFIAIACSLAITACSSDNKGATRYEDLVKNKVDEANKKAEEKAKKDKESETAKKLAELEKKQKELEQQLKQKNQEAPKTEPKQEDIPKVDPKEKGEPKMDPQKENPSKLESKNERTKNLTITEAKEELEKTFKDNGISDGTALLSGGLSTSTQNSFSGRNIENHSKGINTLIVDGKEITLISVDDMKKHRAESDDILDDDKKVFNKIFEINTESGHGKVGSLPKAASKSDFEQMRYGYYTDKNGVTHLFVQGYLTPTTLKESEKVNSPFNYYWMSRNGNSSDRRSLREMPISGVYEYNGKAFYGKGGSYDELTTKAYADFSNRKVKVELSKDSMQTLTFGGDIKGNTFSGSHNGIATKGGFYGSKANDIGGIFYNTNNGNDGVFGGSAKQCGYSGACTNADPITEIK